MISTSRINFFINNLKIPYVENVNISGNKDNILLVCDLLYVDGTTKQYVILDMAKNNDFLDIHLGEVI